MNYAEAETVLREHSAVYAGWSGAKFFGQGETSTKRVVGESGQPWLFAVDTATYDDGAGEYVEVVFTVTADRGRRLLPRMVSASLYLTREKTWNGELPGIGRQ